MRPSWACMHIKNMTRNKLLVYMKSHICFRFFVSSVFGFLLGSIEIIIDIMKHFFIPQTKNSPSGEHVFCAAQQGPSDPVYAIWLHLFVNHLAPGHEHNTREFKGTLKERPPTPDCSNFSVTFTDRWEIREERNSERLAVRTRVLPVGYLPAEYIRRVS